MCIFISQELLMAFSISVKWLKLSRRSIRNCIYITCKQLEEPFNDQLYAYIITLQILQRLVFV